jgi:cbb3-type cytochrome oxidase maturation protein
MSVIYLVVPLAALIALAAVIAFVWGARRGQFDDLDTPAVRMLHDDRPLSSRGATATRDLACDARSGTGPEGDTADPSLRSG